MTKEDNDNPAPSEQPAEASATPDPVPAPEVPETPAAPEAAAPEAVVLADAICAGDLVAEEKARKALLHKYGIWREVSDGRFPDRNTYSIGLTKGRFTEFPE